MKICKKCKQIGTLSKGPHWNGLCRVCLNEEIADFVAYEKDLTKRVLIRGTIAGIILGIVLYLAIANMP